MKRLIVVFIIMILCFLTVSVYAGRKGSFFGKIVDSVKEGAKAVKKDVDNYNTFIVTLDITNNSNQSHPVDIFTITRDGNKAKPNEQIFATRVPSKSNGTPTVELKVYPGQRNLMLRVYVFGHKYDDYVFNPANQDYFNIVIN